MIQIKEVKTRKEKKLFVNFPLKLYKGNNCFVPPLYGDEMAIFKKNYHYNDKCEHKAFLAFKDGKVVGRIHALYHFGSNEKWNQQRVRFTRFDSIDDQEVANKLFDTVKEFALSKGMNEIVGPLGFSDLEREGLLIEGFNELATFEEQYNYPYYQKLIENYGFIKEAEWEERQLFLPKTVDEKYERLTKFIMEKYNLHMNKSKNTNDFLKNYQEQFFDLYEQTYSDIYMSVPLNDETKKGLLSSFKLLVDTKHVAVILDENERVVCFGLCFPSIAKAIQKSNGHLTPCAIVRLLKAIKKPEILDMAMIGVRDEYKMKGVATVLLYEVIKMLQNPKIKFAETNLTLETNTSINNQWKMFDTKLHKRRRSYVVKIN